MVGAQAAASFAPNLSLPVALWAPVPQRPQSISLPSLVPRRSQGACPSAPSSACSSGFAAT